MIIKYGFVQDGGFLVLTPSFAEYAYPTSDCANTAARNPKPMAIELAKKHYACAKDSEFLAHQSKKIFTSYDLVEIGD